MVLVEPLLCCLGSIFWVIVMQEDPPSVLMLRKGGILFIQEFIILRFVHWPLNASKLPFSLYAKTAPNHVSTSILNYGKGVLWIILTSFHPPNTVGSVDAE